MSSIGDYIHYSVVNYYNYGTGKNQNEPGSSYASASSVFESQKNHIKNSIRGSAVNENSLSRLSFLLTKLIYGDPSLSRAKDEEWKRFQDIIAQNFEKQFGDGLGINWNGLAVYDINKTISIKNDGTITLKKLKQTKENLDKEIQRLNTEMTHLSKNSTVTLEEIEKTTQELANFINSQTDQNVKIEDPDLLYKINKAILAESLPKNRATGAVFEQFLGIAQYCLDGKANKLTDDLIEKGFESVKGNIRSSVVIDKNKFSSKYVNFTSSGDIQITENMTYKITANKTQDKLDVIFNWDNENLNVTAKNYSLKDDGALLHLVSKTSLLYLIQNENADFVNHWLNLVVIQRKGSKASKDGILNLAHEAMKITIFAKALTGQGLGRIGEADTFILNNRSKRNVYVISVTDMINTAASDINKFAAISGYKKVYQNKWISAIGIKEKSVKGIERSNFSAASAQQRISNLIAQVHATQISVQINPTKYGMNNPTQFAIQ